MFNQEKWQQVLQLYKDHFNEEHWQNEKYKWEAVKWFQDNWDLQEKDFPEMLKKALAKTYNLLSSNNNFPRKMILGLAEREPEKARGMFERLFDESGNYFERIGDFKAAASTLLKEHRDLGKHHYQTENAISIYLWLRYPDKYMIYKFSVARVVARSLGAELVFKQGSYRENLENHQKLYNAVNKLLLGDNEMKAILDRFMNNSDAAYPDPYLKTLAIDFCYFVSQVNGNLLVEVSGDGHKISNGEGDLSESTTSYWWLISTPSKFELSKVPDGGSQKYSAFNDDGNKRRIFQNFLDARKEDLVIWYESQPITAITAIGRIKEAKNGDGIEVEKLKNLSNPISYDTIKNTKSLAFMQFMDNPSGTLFKLTVDEFKVLTDLIIKENPELKDALDLMRNIRIDLEATSHDDQVIEPYSKKQFLDEVFMDEEQYEILVGLLRNKKNIILQGAPGVGKTFVAKRLAYSIMECKDDSRIQFVQFHQNYSYEDFVMGYKPVKDGFELQEGIFYKFSEEAAKNPDQEYFFIIDEINRGNLSKIFGELLMLIEKPYRGSSLTLAYNSERFSIPENLYIIGLMNTADRSLAIIDYALRRRFSFFDMEPAFSTKEFKAYLEKVNNPSLNALVKAIEKINREIAEDSTLGSGFCIGHSYLCDAEEVNDRWLQNVVNYELCPLLAEYCFDAPDKLDIWSDMLRQALR